MKGHPCSAKCALCALFSLVSAFALLAVLSIPGIAARSTHTYSLTNGSFTASNPAVYYSISGMSEEESFATPSELKVQNNSGGVCAFYVTLCASGPDTACFPLLSVKGGGADRIEIYLYIDGDVTVGELSLSNYACAEVILSTSAGGSLRINRITSREDAQQTLFATDSGKLAAAVSLPDEYSEIGPSQSVEAPLSLTLQPASTPTYTVAYIVPEKPAYDRSVDGYPLGASITPPVIGDDDGFVTGWYTDPSRSNRWQPETDSLEGDLTLYAEWHTHLYDRMSCDEEGHWFSCSCGKEETNSRQPHRFEETTESADTLAAPADCTHPALYYHSCVCGAVGDTIFESENHPKTPHTEETKDNKIICSVCGTILREISTSGESDKNEPSSGSRISEEEKADALTGNERPVTNGSLLILLIGGLVFILVLVIACSRLFSGKK